MCEIRHVLIVMIPKRLKLLQFGHSLDITVLHATCIYYISHIENTLRSEM